MGVNVAGGSRSSPAAFAVVSRSLIPLSAWLTVVIALLIAASLIAWGWRDMWFVITAPSPQGVGRSVVASLLLLAFALPVVSLVAFCAAASQWDARIGGTVTKLLPGWLPWATGLPPVVVGAVLFFAYAMLRVHLSLGTAAVGLIVLNTPPVCARMLRILRTMPAELQEAAAAAGAEPVFVLFRVLVPRALRDLLASASQAAAEMVGQAAVVILAGGVAGQRDPLSVQIWHFAPNRSLAHIEAAQCIVLLLFVLAFALISDGLARRPIERGSHP